MEIKLQLQCQLRVERKRSGDNGGNMDDNLCKQLFDRMPLETQIATVVQQLTAWKPFLESLDSA